MKIIFFGEDSFSNIVLQSLIDAYFDIVLVVSPYYDNLAHKRLEKNCLRNGIEYIREKDINSNSLFKKLKLKSPDLIVIAHFEKLIKKNIIDLPTNGCINLHPSLLPNYRGMSPQHWPIINGESKTGVTVHFVDETADTGDIIIQREIPIYSDMYVHDLQLKFINIYKTIVVDAIKLLNNNDFIPLKQSHLKGSYYGKLKRQQCKIDLNKSCIQNYNLIKGVSRPYYGAYISDLIIWKAHIATLEEERTIDIIKQNKIGLNYSINKNPYIKLKDGFIIIDKFEKK